MKALENINKVAVFHTSKAVYTRREKRELKGFFNRFSPEYFGVDVYLNEEDGDVYDESGNIVSTIESLNSQDGFLNIDHEYDSYDWKPIHRLTQDEISDFVYGRFGISTEFYELYVLLNEPEAVKILMDLEADEEIISEAVCNEYTIQDLVRENIIELNKEGEYELS